MTNSNHFTITNVNNMELLWLDETAVDKSSHQPGIYLKYLPFTLSTGALSDGSVEQFPQSGSEE